MDAIMPYTLVASQTKEDDLYNIAFARERALVYIGM